MTRFCRTSPPDAKAQFFFFFNDTATTEIYTLSLHDALPISNKNDGTPMFAPVGAGGGFIPKGAKNVDVAKDFIDRKSTRLNSSHANISYAVFCLKKKKNLLTLLVTIADPVST